MRGCCICMMAFSLRNSLLLFLLSYCGLLDGGLMGDDAANDFVGV